MKNILLILLLPCYKGKWYLFNFNDTVLGGIKYKQEMNDWRQFVRQTVWADEKTRCELSWRPNDSRENQWEATHQPGEESRLRPSLNNHIHKQPMWKEEKRLSMRLLCSPLTKCARVPRPRTPADTPFPSDDCGIISQLHWFYLTGNSVTFQTAASLEEPGVLFMLLTPTDRSWF